MRARALRAKRSCGEPGPDGDVGVQDHHGRVPPGVAVPALAAERVERLELRLPAVRLDVVVAERREPGRLAHDRCVRAEDHAIEQLPRAQRVGVVAHGLHEVRVPGLDHRGDRRLVLVPAAEVADDREGEPRGAGRRGSEGALGEHGGIGPDGVGVVHPRRQAGQPDDVVDPVTRVDAGAVLQGHEGVVPGRSAERDDGAARCHALGHRAARQRDGGAGGGRSDHRAHEPGARDVHRAQGSHTPVRRFKPPATARQAPRGSARRRQPRARR